MSTMDSAPCIAILKDECGQRGRRKLCGRMAATDAILNTDMRVRSTAEAFV
ncbi:hypothetical protein IBL26_08170 [Roseomonas aerophila]|uniref:Uncharacterized protein n=1 Tax=Teichococcus aerophilus TaxID=1224513 RepID=A0ABR7RJP9_9PROT|nr:hypothetical protein [Pseudoroseomonas aerophila]MBC9206809.1 hypothetical protein [Pseudoroseomonas aerophila]